MANNKAIQILRGRLDFNPEASLEVLEDGQPFYSKKEKKLYIGDGSTELKGLRGTYIGLPMTYKDNYIHINNTNNSLVQNRGYARVYLNSSDATSGMQRQYTLTVSSNYPKEINNNLLINHGIFQMESDVINNVSTNILWSNFYQTASNGSQISGSSKGTNIILSTYDDINHSITTKVNATTVNIDTGAQVINYDDLNDSTDGNLKYGMNLNNSDIIGANSIYFPGVTGNLFDDYTDHNSTEGLMFYEQGGIDGEILGNSQIHKDAKYSRFYLRNGFAYITPNQKLLDITNSSTTPPYHKLIDDRGGTIIDGNLEIKNTKDGNPVGVNFLVTGGGTLLRTYSIELKEGLTLNKTPSDSIISSIQYIDFIKRKNYSNGGDYVTDKNNENKKARLSYTYEDSSGTAIDRFELSTALKVEGNILSTKDITSWADIRSAGQIYSAGTLHIGMGLKDQKGETLSDNTPLLKVYHYDAKANTNNTAFTVTNDGLVKIHGNSTYTTNYAIGRGLGLQVTYSNQIYRDSGTALSVVKKYAEYKDADYTKEVLPDYYTDELITKLRELAQARAGETDCILIQCHLNPLIYAHKKNREGKVTKAGTLAFNGNGVWVCDTEATEANIQSIVNYLSMDKYTKSLNWTTDSISWLDLRKELNLTTGGRLNTSQMHQLGRILLTPGTRLDATTTTDLNNKDYVLIQHLLNGTYFYNSVWLCVGITDFIYEAYELGAELKDVWIYISNEGRTDGIGVCTVTPEDIKYGLVYIHIQYEMNKRLWLGDSSGDGKEGTPLVGRHNYGNNKAYFAPAYLQHEPHISATIYKPFLDETGNLRYSMQSDIVHNGYKGFYAQPYYLRNNSGFPNQVQRKWAVKYDTRNNFIGVQYSCLTEMTDWTD